VGIIDEDYLRLILSQVDSGLLQDYSRIIQDLYRIKRNYPGYAMFSDESDLVEVRAIEEGFKKAYDEDSKGTSEAINKLRDFTIRRINQEVTAENELDAKALLIATGDIGRVAAEKRMEPACLASSRALELVTIEAIDKERESLAVKALYVLGNLALDFATKGMDSASKGAAESLGNCGKISSRRKMETLVSLAEVYLMQFAVKALEKNLSGTASDIIGLIGEIGISSAEQKIEKSTTEAALLLEDLGNTALRKKDELHAKVIIQALGNLGKAASQYGLKISLVQTVWSLETLRVLAREQGLKAVCQAAEAELEPLSTADVFDEEQNLEKIEEIKEFHHRILKKS